MTQVMINRLNEILGCLAQSEGQGITRKKLAECLGIKVTPYLINLCNTLVREGYATQEQDLTVYPPRWVYFYTGKE